MPVSPVSTASPSLTLNQVKIVLVEPAGALNVGSIARVMKNLGLQQLVLVNPHCDPLSPEARQMAVHAAELLEAAEVVMSLPEALKGCRRAIATTARSRALETSMELPETALPWLIEPTDKGERVPTALIFGPEDRGLSNNELNYAQRFVRIPSSDAYPSLNLAQSVAICCYELRRAVLSGSDGAIGQPQSLPLAEVPLTDAAPLDQLEAYYQHLETLLLQIGYLYPHTANSRMEKFRRLFNRASLTRQEVAMLRGILSQLEWALETKG